MIKPQTTFLLALGLIVPYTATAKEVTLRKECTASRCVYYKGSKRVFSVEREQGTERYVVRDSRGSLSAKVTENRDGTIDIKEADRRR